MELLGRKLLLQTAIPSTDEPPHGPLNAQDKNKRTPALTSEEKLKSISLFLSIFLPAMATPSYKCMLISPKTSIFCSICSFLSMDSFNNYSLDTFTGPVTNLNPEKCPLWAVIFLSTSHSKPKPYCSLFLSSNNSWFMLHYLF